MQRHIHPFCRLLVHFQLLFIVNSTPSSATYKAPVYASLWRSLCASLGEPSGVPSVDPWLYCQVHHQLQHKIHLFLQFFELFHVFSKVKSYVRFRVQHLVFFPVHLFIESFCAILEPPCASSSATNCYLKCTFNSNLKCIFLCIFM